MFEMLCGHPPFQAKDEKALYKKILTSKVATALFLVSIATFLDVELPAVPCHPPPVPTFS